MNPVTGKASSYFQEYDAIVKKPLDEADPTRVVYERRLQLMSRPAKTYSCREFGSSPREFVEDDRRATSASTMRLLVMGPLARTPD